MIIPIPEEIAEIIRMYHDYTARTNLAPNLLIVGPANEKWEGGSVMGMRVIVNQKARTDFEVAYVL